MPGAEGEAKVDWLDIGARKLKGAWIVDANFGDMDWASDTPATISITIRMDYAILNY